jgi:hypothetical protein
MVLVIKVLWWERLKLYKGKSMTTGVSDSLSRGQAINYQTSSFLTGTTIKKQILIFGTALLIAIFCLVTFKLIVRAKGQDTPVSNASVKKTAPNQSSPSASSSDSQASSSVPHSNSSSVDIKLNSTSTSTNGVNSSSSDLTVNGQHIPTNGGNVEEHYISSDGSTTVNISDHTNSSSGSSN